ncbi:MAG: hypothetical protein HOV81_04685 [Kofleriaceae bacterium]|nr:hypothetical protein [Kofleriaceae bacterium]
MARSAWARRIFLGAAFAIGVIAFIVLLDRLGREGIERVVTGTGIYFAVLAVIDVASVMCDAAAIHSFARPQRVPYRRVFVAQMSGLAINRLTPGNSIGEPVKVTMLVEHVPVPTAVSSIIMFNLGTYTVAIATIVLGVPLALLLIDVPGQTQIVLWILTAGLVAVIVVLGWLAHRGALGTLVDLLRQLRLVSAARADGWRIKVADIDAQVRRIGARGVTFVVLSRVLNSIGTVIAMFAAGVPLTAPLVIAQLSIGILITWVSNVIPLGIGIADGTNYALFGVLGSTGTTGLVFTMLNRVRTVLLACIGLAIMLVANLLGVRARSPRPDRTGRARPPCR